MSRKKAEFPKVIRVGQTRATIYKTPTNGCVAFTVVWYEGAVRKRKAFADAGLAEIHANSQVNNLSLGETRAAKLSGEECLEYVRARNTMQGYALSLDTAMSEWREAKEILKGGSLVDAARYYDSKKVLNVPKKTVQEVFDEMIRAKRAEGCSERYVQDLVSRCGKFAREFPREIAPIKGFEIKTWLQELTREGSKMDTQAPRKPVTNRTRNNFRLCIQTLFSFAKAQGYLPVDWNEMDSVPLWKMREEEVEIFTPDELAVLLAVAPANLVPFLAIGAFAGLRTAEIERLDWSKVDLDGGYITVDAGIAKTNVRRLVPIVPSLKAWLVESKKAQGKVLEVLNVFNAVKRLVTAAVLADCHRADCHQAEGHQEEQKGSHLTTALSPKGGEGALRSRFEWKHNALRHSFCSYRLADVKNAAQVSLEAGNSPQMVFRHYRELVTEKAAKAWFAITPESTKVLADSHRKAEKERQAKIVRHPALEAA